MKGVQVGHLVDGMKFDVLELRILVNYQDRPIKWKCTLHKNDSWQRIIHGKVAKMIHEIREISRSPISATVKTTKIAKNISNIVAKSFDEGVDVHVPVHKVKEYDDVMISITIKGIA